MRVTHLLLAVAVAGIFSGCTGEPSSGGAAVAGHVPVRHEIASNVGKAISAGDTYWIEFSTDYSGTAEYSFVSRDQSTSDVGFLRASDFAEWSTGQRVSAWAWHSAVNSVSESASLPPGTYRFVVHCDNSFADCDVTFNVAATY